MLEIDRLRLQLPAGFERRAPRISRLLAEHLAQSQQTRNLSLQRLRAGPIRVAAGDSDRQVARAIARSIEGAIAAQPATGGER